MKRIGILGGLGPLATRYFINLLFEEIIQQYHPTTDQQWPDMIVLIESTVSDRTLCIKSGDCSAGERINAALSQLSEQGCSPIAIPCFTAHALIDPAYFESGALDIRMRGRGADTGRRRHLGHSRNRRLGHLWYLQLPRRPI